MKKEEILKELNTYYTDKSTNKYMAEKLFDLFIVSQQRELLSQYTEFLNWKLPVENEINLIEIDDFIEWLNCG